MKVYLEYIIFINFFIDFIILFGTNKLLKLDSSIKRIILGSIFGETTIIFNIFNLNNITTIILKITISSIMILLSFKKKYFFKSITYFYLLSIILGGVLYLFDLDKNLNIITLLLLIPLVIFIIVKELKNYKTKLLNHYNVEIILNKKKYLFDGMIDTGNNLKDPITKKNVLIVNLKLNINDYKYIIVPFKALNHEGIIYCIKPDTLIIDNKEFNNYLIGISNNKLNIYNNNCILPNCLKEELNV